MVKSPSQYFTKAPGDVIVVDLIGPFPETIDGSVDGLVIHDIFSKLTSVVGLKLKSGAGMGVIYWIKNYNKNLNFDKYFHSVWWSPYRFLG